MDGKMDFNELSNKGSKSLDGWKDGFQWTF